MLLTGPRQVGKSTMLRHLMETTVRAEVSLDDLEERRLAKTDPAMFLKMHRQQHIYYPRVDDLTSINILNTAARFSKSGGFPA